MPGAELVELPRCSRSPQPGQPLRGSRHPDMVARLSAEDEAAHGDVAAVEGELA